jgi:sulfite reductase alpha subunit-like flavoprotein
MAQAVDESLKRLIGQQHVFDRLSQEGRYKRDVY